jgi:DNA (cytosine-5)-methyltransferase 1
MAKRNPDEIAVIDLFAGPGGLGEGFSSLTRKGTHPFRIVLSAEMDPVAQKTLELRSFVRQFRNRTPPVGYWRHLRGELTRDELFALHAVEGRAARKEAQIFELSESNRARLERRLNALALNPDRTVVIGGPPCQAYSVAGRSRNGAKAGWSLENDPRSKLYREYLHVLSHVEPAAFVMENVRGMISARFNGESVFEMIRADLHQPRKALGKSGRGPRYKLFPVVAREGAEQPTLAIGERPHPEDFLVRTEEFGIPQARHRIIILGIAEDLVSSAGPQPIEPVPEEATVKAAIKGLPRIRSVVSSGPDSHERWLKALRGSLTRRKIGNAPADVVQRMGEAIEAAVNHDPGRGGDWIPPRGRRGPVLNHHARGHMESDLHRYLFASSWADVHGVSPTLRDFPMALLPDHANIGRNDGSSIFNDRFRVQVWDHPSTTVVSHISKDGHYYIHPDPAQCRSLTVREAAELQTFPPDYFFCGPRTSQFQQVGNAVPVKLARAIADLVRAAL